MPRGRPVTDQQRARVLDLHQQGTGRNAIARDVGLSRAAVTKIVTSAAGAAPFDRAPTRAATEARRDDMRARRAALAAALIDDAEHLRKRLREQEPVLMSSADGPVMEYLPEPSARSAKDLMAAVRGAVQSHVDLDKHDTDTGAEGAKSMLAGLAEGIAAAVKETT